MHHTALSGDAARTLLTTSQVAALLKRDVTTVNRWAQSGRLRTAAKAPGIRGARLFDPDDIARLDAKQRAAKS